MPGPFDFIGSIAHGISDVFEKYVLPTAKEVVFDVMPGLRVGTDAIAQSRDALVNHPGAETPHPFSVFYNHSNNYQPQSNYLSYLDSLSIGGLLKTYGDVGQKVGEQLGHVPAGAVGAVGEAGKAVGEVAGPIAGEIVRPEQQLMALDQEAFQRMDFGRIPTMPWMPTPKAGQQMTADELDEFTRRFMQNQQDLQLQRSEAMLTAIGGGPAAGGAKTLIGGMAAKTLIPKAIPLAGGTTVGQGTIAALAIPGIAAVPDLWKSMLNEYQHPSDANMTHAIVNFANVYLQVVPGVQSLKGVQIMRKAAVDGLFDLKNVTSDIELAKQGFSQAPEDQVLYRALQGKPPEVENVFLRPEQQRPVLGMSLPEVEQQLAGAGVAMETMTPEQVPLLQNLLRNQGMHDALFNSLKTAMQAAGHDLNDPKVREDSRLLKQVAPDAVRALHRMTLEDLQPAREKFGAEFKYLVSPTTDLFPALFSDAERALAPKADRDFWGGVMPILGTVAHWGGPERAPGQIGAILEQAGLAYDPMKQLQRQSRLHMDQALEGLGLTTQDWTKVTKAMMDGDTSKLNPAQMLFGRLLRQAAGTMTEGRLMGGSLALADPNYAVTKVRRYLGVPGLEDKFQRGLARVLRHGYTQRADWEVFPTAEGMAVRRVSDGATEFEQSQAARSDDYEATRWVRELFGSKESPGRLGAEIRQLRTDTAKQTSWVTRAMDKVDGLNQEIADTIKTRGDAQYDLDSLTALAKDGQAADPLHLKELKAQVRAATRAVPRLGKLLEEEQAKVKVRAAALEKTLQGIASDSRFGADGERVAQLVGMDKRDIARALKAKPGDQEYLQGRELFTYMVSRFFADQHQSSYANNILSIAHQAVDDLAELYPGANKENLGFEVKQAMQAGKLKPSDRPEALPADVFRDVNDADVAGYTAAIPGFGQKTDLNYRPTVYVRNDIAKKWLDAMSKAENLDQMGTLAKLLYTPLIHTPKRWVMMSPMWHMMNTTGSDIAQLVADPTLAISAKAQLMKIRMVNPEQYTTLVSRAMLAGMQMPQRFQVSHQLAQMRAEDDAQHGFTGMIRGVGALASKHMPHPYNDLVEHGFWKSVMDNGLVAFTVESQKLAAAHPEWPQATREAMAAHVGNQLMGMVNPLYMKQAWRRWRGAVSFAPSYWGNFLRSVEASIMTKVPYASKLGHWAAQHGAEGITPVRMRELDFQQWRETARAQAHWADTYLMTSFVFADMMNVLGSGHHIWENEAGRQLDVDVSNWSGGEQMNPQTGAHERHYISGVPFFARAHDVANALGLGHQWGLSHELTTEDFKNAGGWDKAGKVMGALWDGIRRTAPQKMAQAPQALASLGLHQDLVSMMQTGAKQSVSGLESLAYLVPQGQTIRYAMHLDRMKAEEGLQASTTVGEELGSRLGSGEVRQLLGIPNLFWGGPESPGKVDDEQILAYHQQRVQKEGELQDKWNEVIAGTSTFQEYVQKRSSITEALLTLDAATFPEDSPAKSLANEHSKLWKQYGLDNNKLPEDQWLDLYDQMDQAWQQKLQHSSPQANAIWWQNHDRNWTDGDYLYWETRQLKHALAALVDGEGGAHIRAVNAKYSSLYNYMDPADVLALKTEDPEYAAYNVLVKDMAKASALGAVTSAFSSPYGARVMPPNMTPEQEQAYIEQSGYPLIRGSSLGQMVGGARQAAIDPTTLAMGGQLWQDPRFQAMVRQLANQSQEVAP